MGLIRQMIPSTLTIERTGGDGGVYQSTPRPGSVAAQPGYRPIEYTYPLAQRVQGAPRQPLQMVQRPDQSPEQSILQKAAADVQRAQQQQDQTPAAQNPGAIAPAKTPVVAPDKPSQIYQAQVQQQQAQAQSPVGGLFGGAPGQSTSQPSQLAEIYKPTSSSGLYGGISGLPAAPAPKPTPSKPSESGHHPLGGIFEPVHFGNPFDNGLPDLPDLPDISISGIGSAVGDKVSELPGDLWDAVKETPGDLTRTAGSIWDGAGKAFDVGLDIARSGAGLSKQILTQSPLRTLDMVADGISLENGEKILELLSRPQQYGAEQIGALAGEFFGAGDQRSILTPSDYLGPLAAPLDVTTKPIYETVFALLEEMKPDIREQVQSAMSGGYSSPSYLEANRSAGISNPAPQFTGGRAAWEALQSNLDDTPWYIKYPLRMGTDTISDPTVALPFVGEGAAAAGGFFKALGAADDASRAARVIGGAGQVGSKSVELGARAPDLPFEVLGKGLGMANRGTNGFFGLFNPTERTLDNRAIGMADEFVAGADRAAMNADGLPPAPAAPHGGPSGRGPHGGPSGRGPSGGPTAGPPPGSAPRAPRPGRHAPGPGPAGPSPSPGSAAPSSTAPMTPGVAPGGSVTPGGAPVSASGAVAPSGRGSGATAATSVAPPPITSLGSPSSGRRVTSFKTSKGSVYEVTDRGTTIRTKSPHPEHPGDVGLKPESSLTWYVKHSDWAGQIRAAVRDTDRVRGDERLSDFLVLSGAVNEPRVGYYPIEVWADGSFHLGNKITEITSGSNSVKMPGSVKRGKGTNRVLHTFDTSRGRYQVIDAPDGIRVQQISTSATAANLTAMLRQEFDVDGTALNAHSAVVMEDDASSAIATAAEAQGQANTAAYLASEGITPADIANDTGRLQSDAAAVEAELTSRAAGQNAAALFGPDVEVDVASRLGAVDALPEPTIASDPRIADASGTLPLVDGEVDVASGVVKPRAKRDAKGRFVKRDADQAEPAATVDSVVDQIEDPTLSQTAAANVALNPGDPVIGDGVSRARELGAPIDHHDADPAQMQVDHQEWVNATSAADRSSMITNWKTQSVAPEDARWIRLMTERSNPKVMTHDLRAYWKTWHPDHTPISPMWGGKRPIDQLATRIAGKGSADEIVRFGKLLEIYHKDYFATAIGEKGTFSLLQPWEKQFAASSPLKGRQLAGKFMGITEGSGQLFGFKAKTAENMDLELVDALRLEFVGGEGPLSSKRLGQLANSKIKQVFEDLAMVRVQLTGALTMSREYPELTRQFVKNAIYSVPTANLLPEGDFRLSARRALMAGSEEEFNAARKELRDAINQAALDRKWLAVGSDGFVMPVAFPRGPRGGGNAFMEAYFSVLTEARREMQQLAALPQPINSVDDEGMAAAVDLLDSRLVRSDDPPETIQAVQDALEREAVETPESASPVSESESGRPGPQPGTEEFYQQSLNQEADAFVRRKKAMSSSPVSRASARSPIDPDAVVREDDLRELERDMSRLFYESTLMDESGDGWAEAQWRLQEMQRVHDQYVSALNPPPIEPSPRVDDDTLIAAAQAVQPPPVEASTTIKEKRKARRAAERGAAQTPEQLTQELGIKTTGRRYDPVSMTLPDGTEWVYAPDDGPLRINEGPLTNWYSNTLVNPFAALGLSERDANARFWEWIRSGRDGRAASALRDLDASVKRNPTDLQAIMARQALELGGAYPRWVRRMAKDFIHRVPEGSPEFNELAKFVDLEASSPQNMYEQALLGEAEFDPLGASTADERRASQADPYDDTFFREAGRLEDGKHYGEELSAAEFDSFETDEDLDRLIALHRGGKGVTGLAPADAARARMVVMREAAADANQEVRDRINVLIEDLQIDLAAKRADGEELLSQQEIDERLAEIAQVIDDARVPTDKGPDLAPMARSLGEDGLPIKDDRKPFSAPEQRTGPRPSERGSSPFDRETPAQRYGGGLEEEASPTVLRSSRFPSIDQMARAWEADHTIEFEDMLGRRYFLDGDKLVVEGPGPKRVLTEPEALRAIDHQKRLKNLELRDSELGGFSGNKNFDGFMAQKVTDANAGDQKVFTKRQPKGTVAQPGRPVTSIRTREIDLGEYGLPGGKKAVFADADGKPLPYSLEIEVKLRGEKRRLIVPMTGSREDPFLLRDVIFEDPSDAGEWARELGWPVRDEMGRTAAPSKTAPRSSKLGTKIKDSYYRFDSPMGAVHPRFARGARSTPSGGILFGRPAPAAGWSPVRGARAGRRLWAPRTSSTSLGHAAHGLSGSHKAWIRGLGDELARASKMRHFTPGDPMPPVLISREMQELNALGLSDEFALYGDRRVMFAPPSGGLAREVHVWQMIDEARQFIIHKKATDPEWKGDSELWRQVAIIADNAGRKERGLKERARFGQQVGERQFDIDMARGLGMEFPEKIPDPKSRGERLAGTKMVKAMDHYLGALRVLRLGNPITGIPGFGGDLFGTMWQIAVGGQPRIGVEGFSRSLVNAERDAWVAAGRDNRLYAELYKSPFLLDSGMDLPKQVLHGFDLIAREMDGELATTRLARKGGKFGEVAANAVVSQGVMDKRAALEIVNRTTLFEGVASEHLRGEGLRRFTIRLQEKFPDTWEDKLDDVLSEAKFGRSVSSDTRGLEFRAGRGNEWGGGFSASDVRRATSDDELTQLWAKETNAARQKGIDKVNEMAFSYEALNVDEILRRSTIFHYWLSRATPYHLRRATRNPFLLSGYYKIWQEIEDQRKDENMPAFLSGMFKVLQKDNGVYAAISPLGVLIPMVLFDAYDQEGGFMRSAMSLMNPIFAGALGAVGMTDFVPDLAGTRPIERFVMNFVNGLKGEGVPLDEIPLLGRYVDMDKMQFTMPIEQFITEIIDRSNNVARRHGAPVGDYQPFDRAANEKTQMRTIGFGIAEEWYGPMDTWDDQTMQNVLYAIENTLNGTTTNSDLEQEILSRYGQEGLYQALLSVVSPGGVVTRNKDRDDYLAQAMELGQITPLSGLFGGKGDKQAVQNAASVLQMSKLTDPTWVVVNNQYYSLGSPQGRQAYQGYFAIMYGDVGGNVQIGSQIYSPDQLKAMSDNQRKSLADEWLRANPGYEGLVSEQRKLREEFLAQHPEYNDYQTFKSGVLQTGADKWVDYMNAVSPNFKRQYDAKKAELARYGVTGLVADAELEQWAYSMAGYHAATGQPWELGDRTGAVYDPTKDPRSNPLFSSFFDEAPSGGGSSGGSDQPDAAGVLRYGQPSYVEQDYKDEIAKFQTQSGMMEQMYGPYWNYAAGNWEPGFQEYRDRKAGIPGYTYDSPYISPTQGQTMQTWAIFQQQFPAASFEDFLWWEANAAGYGREAGYSGSDILWPEMLSGAYTPAQLLSFGKIGR